MIKRPFREHHLLSLLQIFEEEKPPLDLCINRYFRTHKSLGSKDRAEIAENAYALVRWKGLLDHFCDPPLNWEKRLNFYGQFDPLDFYERPDIPLHIKLSFPSNLFRLIESSHGPEKAERLCWASNYPAPTTVRINPLKTTRKDMLRLWNGRYAVSPCIHAEHGIIFHKKINFFELPEFKAGLFEVQDEGSQLLAALVQLKPGEQVLDYCSGSGGKTLAFAHLLQGKGQIYLHDVRASILQEARKRLKRAGIQNAQIIPSKDPKLKKLKQKCDWVLVDAPCSGTGTLRRNPDMKWKFSEEALTRLIAQQRVIFEQALSFLKPGGRIVYATCSLLRLENQEQMEHFMKHYPIKTLGEPFQSLPAEGEMDGFFGVVFERLPS